MRDLRSRRERVTCGKIAYRCIWGFKNTPIRIFDSLNVKPLRIPVHIPAVRKPSPFIYYAVNVIAAYSYFDSNPKYTLG